MAVVLAFGCTPVEPSVVVTLRSDWEPGLDVDEVRTAISARRTHLAVRPLARGDDLVAGLVVAELDGVPLGTHRLDVALYRGGVFVAGRSAVVPVESTTSVSVAITRNCEGVVCPAPGDRAGATECEDGRCVPPDCLIDCGEGCTADSDCPSESECAPGRCSDGLCLHVPDDSVCDAGERCEVARGCVIDACDPMACSPSTGCCEGFDTCVSLRTEQRCGACDSGCAAGEVCSAGGECVSESCDSSTCGSTEGCCMGSSTCVDLRTTANCGSCGNTCPAGARCHHDEGSGQTFCTTCSSEDCGGFGVICCPHNSLGNCTNIWADPNHCGGCNRRCSAGQSCVDGACR